MRFALFSALPLCAAMTACATPPPGNGNTPPLAAPAEAGDYNCEKADLSEYKGQQSSPELLEQARRKANARHVRVVKAGMAVTMDYRIDRLTVMLDESGRIDSISCG